MSFAYFPLFQNTNKLADFYLKIIGYPYPSRRVEAEMVFDLLNAKRGEKILDLGCGEGIFTNHLAKTTKSSITGLDISKRDLKVATQSAKALNVKVSYTKANAAHMPFKDNIFDKIYSISTLEHIAEDKLTLKECHRVLKPGGELVISVPSYSNPWLAIRAVQWHHSIKKVLCNSVITISQSSPEYVKMFDEKFNHKRRYSVPSLKKILIQTQFNPKATKHHVTFLGRFAHNIIHTFKVFEWQKTTTTGYSYKPNFLLALLFPLFIPLYEVDRLISHFVSLPGLNIIIKSQKIS